MQSLTKDVNEAGRVRVVVLLYPMPDKYLFRTRTGIRAGTHYVGTRMFV